MSQAGCCGSSNKRVDSACARVVSHLTTAVKTPRMMFSSSRKNIWMRNDAKPSSLQTIQ